MKTFLKEEEIVIQPESIHSSIESMLAEEYPEVSFITNENLFEIVMYTIEWATNGVVNDVSSFKLKLDKLITEEMIKSED